MCYLIHLQRHSDLRDVNNGVDNVMKTAIAESNPDAGFFIKLTQTICFRPNVSAGDNNLNKLPMMTTEHRTCDRKVPGLGPHWSCRRIFFSSVNFLCWLLFRYLFHSRVTAVARKRSQSFCQSAGGRLQLSMHAPYLRGFEWSNAVNLCVVVWCTQNLCQDGSSLTWHQPCNNHIKCCQYTTLVVIKKTRYKTIQSLIQNYMWHEHSKPAWEQRTALYKSDQ